MKIKLLATILLGFITLNSYGSSGLVDLVVPSPLEVMSRSDIDENGFLEGVELEFAATIYERSIIAIADLEYDDVKYAKSIFYFILTYKRIPSGQELANFHYTESISELVVDFAGLQTFFNIAFLQI